MFTEFAQNPYPKITQHLKQRVYSLLSNKGWGGIYTGEPDVTSYFHSLESSD